MTTREMEARVRDLARRSPPAAMRARVMDAAMSAAEAPAISQIHPASIDEPRVARRHRWRTAAVVTIAATFIVIAGCAGLDVWAQHQLDLEIARIAAKYGSLDMATTAPPSVPDSDNRAGVVRAAAELAVAIPDQEHHYIPYPIPSPLPVALRTFASANHAAITRLDDLRTRQRSNWGIDYQNSDWFVDYWTRVAPWQSVEILSDATSLTARLEIEDGRPDAAGRAIASGLGIAASLRQESDSTAHGIQLGLLNKQFDSLRQLVRDLEPSETALKDIAWWLAENRVPSGAGVLLAKMKWTNAVFARMEKGDIDTSVVESLYPITWPDWASAFVRPAAVMGRPFVRMARLRTLRQMERALDVLTGPRPLPAIEVPPPPQPWELVERLAVHFTGEEWGRGIMADDFVSALAVAELGVALRRFKMEHGQYPDDLSTLVPDYLNVLPIDPYTAQPPTYRRAGSGFTLYGGANSIFPDMRKYLALDWDVKR